MIPVKLKHSKPEANFNCIGLTVNPARAEFKEINLAAGSVQAYSHLRTNTQDSDAMLYVQIQQ